MWGSTVALQLLVQLLLRTRGLVALVSAVGRLAGQWNSRCSRQRGGGGLGAVEGGLDTFPLRPPQLRRDPASVERGIDSSRVNV